MISVLVERRLKQDIDPIVDVIVHIDPEDDETSSSVANLPVRSEIMRRLMELCFDVPEFARHRSIVLHYFSSGIELDLFMPIDICRADQPDAMTQLADQLRNRIGRDPLFRRVSVFWLGRLFWCIAVYDALLSNIAVGAGGAHEHPDASLPRKQSTA